ncbi:MAG: TonB-dependent receptor [Halieaceae bacterium]|nr:TonB-dependent receptor [Halieaceae bacterium]MCP4465463.1 TonB-dependent receptor [Halieaceae bacterium]
MAQRPLLLGLTLLVTASYSWSQSVQPDPLALEEVVVTATKRVESIQEVPMSVTAFTSEFFKDSGVTNLSQLQDYTPSLKITPGTDSNSTSIRIRGIGSVGTNVGIDPSVGTFIDGVYQGRAGMSIGDLIDIERIEILRGPQGTLYGKNTAAGAISIITKAPSPEGLAAEVELQYNTDERAEVHAMVNVPFGDTGHAMRLTGYAIDGDHLYENTYNNEDLNNANKWGVKSRVLFDGDTNPDRRLGEFLLTMDYTKEDTDCCALAVIDYDGLSTLNTPSLNAASAALSAQLGNNAQGNPILEWHSFEDSEGFLPPSPNAFDDDNYWVNADITNEVTIGGLALEWNRDLSNENTLTFINAWRHYESKSAYDGDFTAYDAVTGSQDIDFDQYSSEFRITSPGGETFDYQAGLYAFYSKMDSQGTFRQAVPLVTNINVGGFPLSNLFPDGTLNTDDNIYKTTSYAAFGQLIWNITDNFNTTFGLRYTYERKERDGSQITTPVSIIDIPPVAGPDVYYDEARNDDDWSPTIIARYFVTADIMTYASISRGFKSGGFNQRRELEGRNGEFDPETSTNYEIGWKSSTENRRLQFNGSLYFTNYDDFQAQAFDGNNLTVTNAGSMESYGVELDAVFVPMADMVAGAAIGYNKAEYQDFDNGQCTIQQSFNYYFVELDAQGGVPGTAVPACAQDLAGKAIDNAPEWTVSSYVQYEHDLTADLFGKVRVEHNYIDSFYLDQDLDPNLENDSVNLLNLRFTLSNMEQTWEAAIWGQNLLDEEYYAFGLDIPVMGGYAGVVAPGELYGITLRLYY